MDARAYYENVIGLWDPTYRPSVVSPDDPHVASLIILVPDVALPRLCRPGAFAEGRGAGRGATDFAL